MKKSLYLFLFSALFLASLSIYAQDKSLLVQGKLKNSGGEPVDDTLTMKFALYEDDVKTESLWEKGFFGLESVIVKNGIFNVYLNFNTTEEKIFTDYDSMYLGVTIGSGTELPRVPLTWVPYAIRAGNADTCDDITDGTITFVDLSVGGCKAGQVIKLKPDGTAWECGDDLGTTYTGGAGITVTGTVISAKFGDGAGEIAEGNHEHDTIYYSKTEIDTLLNNKSDTTHNHDDKYYTETEVDGFLAGKSDLGHNHDSAYVNISGDTMTGALNLPADGLVAGTNQLVLTGGNVGIGTTNPTAKLHLSTNPADGIRISATGKSDRYIGIDESDNLQIGDWEGGVGSKRIVMDNSGNVSIGKLNPTAKLDVNGNVKWINSYITKFFSNNTTATLIPDSTGAKFCALTMVDDDSYVGWCRVFPQSGNWYMQTGGGGGDNQCEVTCFW